MLSNFFKNKKILVTGATGVIGANLCIWLKQFEDAEVHINYLNELGKGISFLNELGYIHKRFDISDVNEINKLEEYDIIYHLSGYGQPKKFVENPEKTFFLNTTSLSALVNKVKVGGHFLFMSSSELYAGSVHTKEGATISIESDNIRNCYILGKLCGEQNLAWAAKARGINYKIVRICLAYGPCFKKSDTRVLNELIFKAIDKGEIELMDDGSAIRQYIFIDDALAMMGKILVEGQHNIYNVGGIHPISILHLAKIIAEQTNAKIKIGNSANKLQNSPSFAGVNIDRFEKEFGRLVFTPIEKGIQECLKWYKVIA